MPNPPKQPYYTYPDWQCFKGPARLVYYVTLTLNISASRQNIQKSFIGTFGAIHVGILHQVSSFTGVGGEWGDWRTCDVTPDP